MAPTPHYFDPEPVVPSRPRVVDLVLPDLTLHLTTDRGVFAAAAIDPGTKLLLLDGPAPHGATLLDLGCGYGPIALTLAKRAPGATVWAVDVNDRALALTQANAAANGVMNVEVGSPPDDVLFDEIWSNPPIRIGKAALHDLLSHWLARLAPSGVARFVVQRNLGSDSLAAWLGGQGWTVERVRARQGYRVLEVRP